MSELDKTLCETIKSRFFLLGNADGYGKICGGYGEMTEKEGE